MPSTPAEFSAAGQFFCATSCMTSASRMTFAFSRDGAIPGSAIWRKLTSQRVPANAVVMVAVISAIVTAPALIQVNLGTAAAPLIIPVAFYAVTSIAVIGLYLAFAIPIWLRWRAGDRFEHGVWSLGNHYKWLNPLALLWILLICILFLAPSVPQGIPGKTDFSWDLANYAPLTVGGAFILFGGWWLISANRWFKGPISQGSEAELERIEAQLGASG